MYIGLQSIKQLIVCNYWLKYRPWKVVKKMSYIGKANIKKRLESVLFTNNFISNQPTDKILWAAKVN